MQVNGNWYYASQMVTDSFTTSLGCDSIVYTDVTINYMTTTSLSATACDSAQVNGNWYYTSQMVTDSFTTSLGCDSIVYTDVTINNSIVVFDTIYACLSYELNLKVYETTQEVVLNYTTNNGCDSTIYCQLYINQPVQINHNLTGCNFIEYNGVTYRVSTSFVDTVYGQGFDCDTFYNVSLNVNHSSYEEYDVNNCYSATINGNTYTSSTTVVINETAESGCDSISVYHVVISNPIFSSESIRACESVVYNGVEYTSSVEVVDTLVSSQGCDSIHTASLVVTQPIIQTKEANACPGEKYQLSNGELVTVSGSYSSVFTAQSGCDSIIIENINYTETETSSVPDIEKCIGDELLFDITVWDSFEKIKWGSGEENVDLLLSRFGNYTVQLTDYNGCIVTDTFEVIDANCPVCPVFTPNAFTPNGFSGNETFKPVHECSFNEYKFQIYNRWGERLFETYDPELSWDGVYKGEDCQQDVYVWVLFYVDKKTTKGISQRGTVTLLR